MNLGEDLEEKVVDDVGRCWAMEGGHWGSKSLQNGQYGYAKDVFVLRIDYLLDNNHRMPHPNQQPTNLWRQPKPFDNDSLKEESQPNLQSNRLHQPTYFAQIGWIYLPHHDQRRPSRMHSLSMISLKHIAKVARQGSTSREIYARSILRGAKILRLWKRWRRLVNSNN